MVDTNIIYNEDCLSGMKRLPDKSIDVGFTSPPYNRKRNDKYSNYDDNIENYYDFLVQFTDELLRICKKNVFVNIQATYYNRADVYRYIGHYSDKITNIFIWEKSNPMPCAAGQVCNAVEYFIAFGKLKPKYNYVKNIITTSVNTSTSKIHKALMNPEVADYFIKYFSDEGDTVIDPFMGLATTALSCIKFKRNYIGFEINEEYFNEGNKRIESELAKS